MDGLDENSLKRLTKTELKALIKCFKKEKNIGKMSKAELVAYLLYLIQYGQLRKNHEQILEGSGFFDLFRRPKEDFTNSAKKFLKTYGGMKVLEIKVVRQPVVSLLSSAINVLSLGIWKRELKKNNIEKLYHLYMLLTLDNNGRQVMVRAEKNHVIEFSSNASTGKGAEVMNINVRGNITLNSMIEQALKNTSPQAFFRYSGLNDYRNCQDWIIAMLSSSGLMNPSAQAFIKQDLSKVAEKLPSYVSKTMDVITEIPARLQHAFGGNEHEVMCKNCSKSLHH
jgi:hypothetical protein